MQGHAGAVYVCAFSNSGRHIASCSLDKTVKLWHASGSGTDAIVTLLGHARSVADVCWSSDAAQLASGGFDSVARRWDVETHAALAVHAVADASVKPPVVLAVKYIAAGKGVCAIVVDCCYALVHK